MLQSKKMVRKICISIVCICMLAIPMFFTFSQTRTVHAQAMDDFPPNPLDKPGWTLTTHDEFDESSLNTNLWLNSLMPHTFGTGLTAHEQFLQDNGNSVVRIYNDASDQDPTGQYFPQAGGPVAIQTGDNTDMTWLGTGPTVDNVNQFYGYYEFRGKCPFSAQGFNNSSWWMTQIKPSWEEIDTFETGNGPGPTFNLRGAGTDNLIAVHGSYPGARKVQCSATNYTEVGIEVYEYGIREYLNNQLINETAVDWNITGTSPWAHIISTGDTLGAEVFVDYWRAYKKNPTTSPAIPTLTGPADGATDILPNGANLSWDTTSNSSNYQVYLGTDSIPTPTGYQATTQGTSFTATALLPHTKYYWTIAAVNSDGVRTFSPIHSFTTGRTDLALNKTPTASSTLDNDGFALTQATDGDVNKGWTSDSNTGSNHSEWLQVDLGSTQNINSVGLYPRTLDGVTGVGFPNDFTIQTTTDDPANNNWTTVVDKQGYTPTTGLNEFIIGDTPARYIRVTGTNLRSVGGEYRMQLMELTAYDENRALNASVSATSSVEGYGWSKNHVVDGITDGNIEHGWSSADNISNDHTESITLDLGSNQNISTVKLYPRNDTGFVGEGFPVNFTIKVKTDTQDWTTVVTQQGYAKPDNSVQTFTFNAQAVRYVQIEGTSLRPDSSDGNTYRMQFEEIGVY